MSIPLAPCFLKTSLGAALQQVDRSWVLWLVALLWGRALKMPVNNDERGVVSFRRRPGDRFCRSSPWGCQILLWFHSASVAPDPSGSSQPNQNTWGNLTSRWEAFINSHPLCVCLMRWWIGVCFIELFYAFHYEWFAVYIQISPSLFLTVMLLAFQISNVCCCCCCCCCCCFSLWDYPRFG